MKKQAYKGCVHECDSSFRAHKHGGSWNDGYDERTLCSSRREGTSPCTRRSSRGRSMRTRTSPPPSPNPTKFGRARFHHPINESSRAAHPISRLAGPLWASRMPSCQSKPDEQFRTCPDSRSVHNDRRRCGRRAPPDRRFDDVARWCFYQARQREEG